MTCRDFEDAWHDRLDGHAQAATALADALEAHAARCPSCRERGRRFETLHQAILALGPAPAAPEGAAARILARAQDEAARARPYSFETMYIRLAMAAAVLLALGIGLVWSRSASRNVAWHPLPAPGVRPALPLSSALAVATSATADLAREASAPAARVGLRALDATAIPAAPAVGEVPVAPTSRVLETVEAGVRPLSGSARHAFAFLIRPAPGPHPRPAPARNQPRSE
jgi:hypothetical protein